MTRTPFLRLSILAAALGAAFAVSAQVTPPPLPIGSSMVRVDPGVDVTERKRSVRAHHTKAHNKKDFTKDDSEEDDKKDKDNNGNGNGNGNGKKDK